MAHAGVVCPLLPAGGFGAQRDPQAQQDGEAPEDLAQRARDINSPAAQEDATKSGPRGFEVCRSSCLTACRYTTALNSKPMRLVGLHGCAMRGPAGSSSLQFDGGM